MELAVVTNLFGFEIDPYPQAISVDVVPPLGFVVAQSPLVAHELAERPGVLKDHDLELVMLAQVAPPTGHDVGLVVGEVLLPHSHQGDEFPVEGFRTLGHEVKAQIHVQDRNLGPNRWPSVPKGLQLGLVDFLLGLGDLPGFEVDADAEVRGFQPRGRPKEVLGDFLVGGPPEGKGLVDEPVLGHQFRVVFTKAADPFSLAEGRRAHQAQEEKTEGGKFQGIRVSHFRVSSTRARTEALSRGGSPSRMTRKPLMAATLMEGSVFLR